MRLLIVSNMAHYRRDGRVVGWGPTVREIDELATLFDKVTHLACMHRGAPPESALPYESDRVSLVELPPAGGDSWWSKLQVLALCPGYVRRIWRELKDADCVHVRCPANISMLGVMLLAVASRPWRRWVKYAGNWRPQGPEPWSYTFQRWWLRRNWHRGVVTVNGEWPGEPEHVRPFLNPCLSEEELRDGAGHRKQLSVPIRLVFAGRVEEEKGCGRAIEVVRELDRMGIPSELDVAGDGPQRLRFEELSKSAGLAERIHFLGWVPRPSLPSIYRRAHFLLLPSLCSEGWPKVVSEAMAYGAVPLSSTVSSIPGLLARFRTGRAIEATDVLGFATAIAEYLKQPARWQAESDNAKIAASRFSYREYAKAVTALLGLGEGERTRGMAARG